MKKKMAREMKTNKDCSCGIVLLRPFDAVLNVGDGLEAEGE